MFGLSEDRKLKRSEEENMIFYLDCRIVSNKPESAYVEKRRARQLQKGEELI